jgi:hypothetical protein
LTVKPEEHAEKYVQRSLESQKQLGYSARIDDETYESAVAETARAVKRLLRAQNRRAA